jgi:hypothetical protein
MLFLHSKSPSNLNNSGDILPNLSYNFSISKLRPQGSPYYFCFMHFPFDTNEEKSQNKPGIQSP